ncbi:hypothetical protein BU24DRAFT_154392 [Aaosphaeria arxii CBS 175.79]|uniref:Uncharacterized protein n=1 Tax=Aaosphaeria arxii CBS 175.79 TaxID=1450172 RepID=A0A6A5XWT9_9PLEO|nr:uncharacterized protein BU24DRAFT_154392 [Aaosphaeria arxii CBS 175.79]KAF2017622.1 hypothetical protein BU24DRAFT_154392 [Aaosphaeria arxii CBS 175.79]
MDGQTTTTTWLSRARSATFESRFGHLRAHFFCQFLFANSIFSLIALLSVQHRFQNASICSTRPCYIGDRSKCMHRHVYYFPIYVYSRHYAPRLNEGYM